MSSKYLSIEARPLWNDPATHVIARQARSVTRTGEAPTSVAIGLGGRDQTLAYADRVVNAAGALNAQSVKQIVYQDPDKLAGTAGDLGTGEPAQVGILRARVAKKGPTQSAKELAWSNAFGPWFIALLQYRESIDGSAETPGFSWTGPSAAAVWSRMQQYEAELRAYQQSYNALGDGAQAPALPETLETGTGKAEADGPNWLQPVLWGLGIVSVAWGLSSVAHLVRG